MQVELICKVGNRIYFFKLLLFHYGIADVRVWTTIT